MRTIMQKIEGRQQQQKHQQKPQQQLQQQQHYNAATTTTTKPKKPTTSPHRLNVAVAVAMAAVEINVPMKRRFMEITLNELPRILSDFS